VWDSLTVSKLSFENLKIGKFKIQNQQLNISILFYIIYLNYGTKNKLFKKNSTK